MKAIRTVGIAVLWWSTVLLRGAMAQQPEAIVTAVILPQQVPDTLELELFVQRPSLRWERWSNGTLCFTLPDTLPIQWQRLRVRLVPGTTVLDTSVYRIEPFVVWEPIRPGAAFTRPRVGLTVLGPESFQQAQLIPWDTLIRLGRVQIFSLDGSPVLYQWSWAQPLSYYQAFAFKQLADELPWERADDNLELRTEYRLQPMRVPAQAIVNFRAVYVGDRTVALRWESRSEAFNRGFTLVRWWKPFNTEELRDSAMIADWQSVVALRGLGTSDTGRAYEFLDADRSKLRGEEYCYDLWSTDFFGQSRYHGRVCVAVPHSVISFAQVEPNPFSDQTTLRYVLEDRVLLSIKVYDLKGKEVQTLMERREMPRGSYTLEWRTPAYASQGLYDIVLIAYPVDDPTVELSRAVVKAQLVR
jgi:hypothetical protein